MAGSAETSATTQRSLRAVCVDVIDLGAVETAGGQKRQSEAQHASLPGTQSCDPFIDRVPLDKNDTIAELRTRCPLPVLMQRMGHARSVKPSCCSPLRPDKTPSWGVYQSEGRWFWKDHGTGESGDEIGFILQAKKLSPKKSFLKALAFWKSIADGGTDTPDELALPEPEPRCKPDLSGFGPGTDGQLDRLASLRGIERQGLLVARERGLLVFGTFINQEVFGVTDASGNLLEVRRLDGQTFRPRGDLTERKSHALRGSSKSWPVGIANADARPMILLVEGLPDFLAAFEVVVREDALDRVAPVALLSASARISDEALPLFKGRQVRIVPHADTAGTPAAARWTHQLRDAGAVKVDHVRLTNSPDGAASPVKDLNEYLPIYRKEMAAGLSEGRLLS